MTLSPREPGNAGAHWSRLASRRLRLSDEAEIVRQVHRGVLWHIVRDRLGDRYYRLTPDLYTFLSLLDGRRTVDDAYRIVLERFGEDAPGEVEVIKLLWRLHAADLLKGDTVGRTDEIVGRAERMDRQRWLMQLRSPLAVRVPLLDPAPLLDRLGWLARAAFSWPAFLAWLAVLALALGQVAVRWTELTGNFSDRVLSYDNLILMWFVFPVVKLLHEIGHGLALRRWGCRSHEMGIMFLVFMPVPYVDASSSAVMVRPAQRAAVGAAGLYAELFVAALAALLWAGIEPGLMRAICFNVMIVAGASAVLFNGNPLLKFDAYFVLSDLLEMPNLAQRSGRWWLQLIQRALLGLEPQERTVEAQGERPWLILYAPLSLAYRLFLMFAIAIFVAKQAFYLGTALAVVAVFNVVLWPLIRGALFLARSPRLRARRTRAVLRTGVALGALAGLVFWVPVPHRSLAEGVVWYSEGAELTPAAAGTVVAFEAQSGEGVARGEVIARLADPEIRAEIDGLGARLVALRSQHRRELTGDRSRAPLTAEEIAYVEERLAAARARAQGLTFTSPASGTLVIPHQRDLQDGWLTRGAPIGHVVGDEAPLILAVLRQQDVELVAGGVEAISIRLSTDLAQAYPARIGRLRPQATDELPSPLLAAEGGGPFSVRQNMPGERGLRTIEKLFVLEVALDDDVPAVFGSRVHVLLDFGAAPLAVQAERALRQLFLREFGV